MKNAWYKEHLTDGKSSPPFSFTYDGQPSAPLLAKWPVKAADERLDASRTRRTLTWTDPKTGLEVRCVALDYADCPAVEWALRLRNTGTDDTPLLSELCSLDAGWYGAAHETEEYQSLKTEDWFSMWATGGPTRWCIQTASSRSATPPMPRA